MNEKSDSNGKNSNCQANNQQQQPKQTKFNKELLADFNYPYLPDAEWKK